MSSRSIFPLLLVGKMYNELFHLSCGKLMDISCGLLQMRAVAVSLKKEFTHSEKQL